MRSTVSTRTSGNCTRKITARENRERNAEASLSEYSATGREFTMKRVQQSRLGYVTTADKAISIAPRMPGRASGEGSGGVAEGPRRRGRLAIQLTRERCRRARVWRVPLADCVIVLRQALLFLGGLGRRVLHRAEGVHVLRHSRGPGLRVPGR